jgi:hypothetical protein
MADFDGHGHWTPDAPRKKTLRRVTPWSRKELIKSPFSEIFTNCAKSIVAITRDTLHGRWRQSILILARKLFY